jgi:tRNA (cytidine/uridine-2'-O-)-methyltransferase
MLHIVLHEPQIPPNTGNIIRLAANTGFALHLIEPMAFTLDHAKMRRAGLDYHEFANVSVHASLSEFQRRFPDARIFAFSTRSRTLYTQAAFHAGDALLFGSETKGLPGEVLEALPPEQRLTLAMTANGRSLNLANAVAIASFEAWRQLGFAGARDITPN